MTQSRVVVVTGASAGVGRATALAFARRGALLGLIARGRNGLEATAREVRAAGGRALVLPLDVADPDHVDGAADAVERELGGIDVWVNHALLPPRSPGRTLRPADFRRAAATSYLGGVHGVLAAVHRMVPRDRGVIVQVGSSVAQAMPLWMAWRATKHAIQSFIASLRSELIHDQSRVRVTTVHLPELEPLPFEWANRLPGRRAAPRVLPPEAAARAIVYAAEHDVGRDLVVGWSGSSRRTGRRPRPAPAADQDGDAAGATGDAAMGGGAAGSAGLAGSRDCVWCLGFGFRPRIPRRPPVPRAARETGTDSRRSAPWRG